MHTFTELERSESEIQEDDRETAAGLWGQGYNEDALAHVLKRDYGVDKYRYKRLTTNSHELKELREFCGRGLLGLQLLPAAQHANARGIFAKPSRP